ncbi:hypothetical protein F4678DRAFT_463660 [Xylaria arbuscula]|nr:hypothetical protein F4678DRAFT_463660 [Xylaria arbuscula]
MASAMETVGSSPSDDGTPPSSSNPEQEPKVREWSRFELDTVCALICKNEHHGTSKEKIKKRPSPGDENGERSDNQARDWILRFATKLNEALHGTHNYKHDIPLTDVRELMDFLEMNHKAVMMYIRRQSTPFRITRSKKYAFQRLCIGFNNTFYRWVLMRRERRRNPSLDDTEKRRSSFNQGEYSLSSQNQDNCVLSAARIQKNVQLRSREFPSINITSSSDQDPKVDLTAEDRWMDPMKPNSLLPRRSQHGTIGRPPPPPPHTWSTPSHYNSMGIPPFQASDGYESINPGGHTHPARRAYLDPNVTPTTTPLPPASPVIFNHAGLRQTIHPTGPRPETPLPAYQHHSELQQGSQLADQQTGTLGQLTSPAYTNPYDIPMHSGRQYPRPQQENGDRGDTNALETPASPVSPAYMPGPMSPAMIGAYSGTSVYGNGYGNDYGDDLYGGYGENSLDY